MPEPIINEDGSFAPDWYEGFDEGSHATLSRITRFDDLVNSHMEQRKKVGELGEKLGADPDNVLIIPGEDASDAVKEAYRARLGVKDAADYVHTKADGIKDDFLPSDDEMKVFVEMARDLNMSPESFNKMMNGYLAIMDGKKATFDETSIAEEKKALANAEAAAKKLMGSEFDSRRDRAEILFNKYSAMEVKNEKGEVVGTVKEMLFDQFPGLKNSPNMLMVLDGIAGDMSEDRIKGLGGAVPHSAETIDAQLDELRKHPAAHDRSHAEFKEIDDKRNALLAQRQALV